VGRSITLGARRVLVAAAAPALACAALLAPACAAGAPGPAVAHAAGKAPARKLTASNWDLAAQSLVVGDGIMGDEGPGAFAGAARLSPQEASAAMAQLAAREEVAPIAVQGNAPVTVVGFDALLVDQLGLGEVAAHVQQVAAAAGLNPPSYFGSEVVARYLEVRYEHPVGEQSLDLYPWEPITRAEAAHSFAVLLESGSWAISSAREALSGFSLPSYDAAQLEVLRLAVSKIGMPYVWGGTTDNTADGLEHGGYDCSGFVWRVYKVSGLPWGKQILGRTAAQQAGEIPKSQRIHLEDVQGGDLLFFGSAHFDSTATESNVIHEGLALSDEWAINSSGQGVYVLPLTSGWLAQSFTWARRVL
jgi:cell wall-associated NlpC family hydrolase